MSRIFKSTYINVGQPLEIITTEREQREIIYKRKEALNDRSSNMKSKDPSEAASSIIERANIEANDIIDRMNEQAEKIISDARIQADLIRSDALREGYRDGYKDGLDMGKKETEDLANQALAIKEELVEEEKNIIKSFENNIPTIVMQAIKKIVGREIANGEDIILGIISQTFNKSHSTINAVRVSESDYETVENNKDKILSECKEVSDFEVKKDLALEQGDCVAETTCGEIDAGINTQVEKLEETILGAIEDEK